MLSITNCLSLMLCFILWLCLCSDLQSRWLERPNRNEKGRGEKEGEKQRRQKVRGETDRNIDRETSRQYVKSERRDRPPSCIF